MTEHKPKYQSRSFYPCHSSSARRFSSRTSDPQQVSSEKEQAPPHSASSLSTGESSNSNLLVQASSVLYRLESDGQYHNMSDPTRKLSPTQYNAITKKALQHGDLDDIDIQLLCGGETCSVDSRPMASVTLFSANEQKQHNRSMDADERGSVASIVDTALLASKTTSDNTATGVCTEACDVVPLSTRSMNNAPALSPSGGVATTRGGGLIGRDVMDTPMTTTTNSGPVAGNVPNNNKGTSLLTSHYGSKKLMPSSSYVKEQLQQHQSSRLKAYKAMLLPIRRVSEGEFAMLSRANGSLNVLIDPFTCAPFVIDDKQNRCYSVQSIAREIKPDDIDTKVMQEFGFSIHDVIA